MAKIELHETDLQKFNVTDAVIAKYSEDFMPLKINGLEDKEGLKQVHDARMTIVKKRTEVEKVRKELKADALEYGRQVDGEAKRIFALLEPIENHLDSEEQKIKEEENKIKAEKEAEQQKIYENRIGVLLHYGMIFTGSSYVLNEITITTLDLKIMGDEKFDFAVGLVENEFNIIEAKKAEAERLKKEEEERLAKVAEDQKIEAERLAKIQKEQDEKAEEIRLAQQKINDENARIAKEKQDKIEAENRAKELEQAKKDAAEKAIKDAEAKRKADEEKRIADELAAQKKRERADNLRPDKEKLLAFASLIDAIILPVVKTKDAKLILGIAVDSLELTSHELIKQANLLK